MGMLAAHLNDAGILVSDGERVLCREPGFALLEEDGLVTGADAWESARLKPRRIQNRFWIDLRTEPLADQRFRHLTAADLVSRQLEAIWKRVAKQGDHLVVAVPGYMKSDQLGLFLGIAEDLGIPVVGMVDAAVSATRRQYAHGVPVHVDLGLHCATLTRLAQEGQVQFERAAVVDDAGVLDLYDLWLRAIAEIFVQQSRFDPLHTAETEQALQDRMPAWLDAAATSATVSLQIEYRGITHQAEVESLELVAAAAPVYQTIVSNLRALYRADEMPAIQLSDRAARMPGLAETLKARVGGEAFVLEPGATARGLISRAGTRHRGGAVSLLRHLPWDQSSIEVRARSDDNGTRPTHLLLNHRAVPIAADPLVLGSQQPDAERWLDLQREVPGVSRRHCAIAAVNGQCVVTDFSRYGTFLNGHRIDGSAVLQPGDVIRVGTPGVELRLISVEDSDGS